MSRNVVPTIQTVVDVMNNTLNGISRTFKETEPSSSAVDECKATLVQIRKNLLKVQTVLDVTVYNDLECKLTSIESMQNNISTHKESNQLLESIARLPKGNSKGNSYCDIDKSRLLHLLSLGFSVRKIAKEGLLGGVLHHNTIHRFMKRENIRPQKLRFTNISDIDLSNKISELSNRFPNSGIREMIAHLRVANPPIIVQFSRVSKTLLEIDPIGSTRRWSQVIKRRKYKVETPNSLWHIDTNHKLIRWNFVVDGGIDGYSRLVPYLKINTNNLALSACHDFFVGVRNYGVPSRVRSDHGGEFTHIWKFMEIVNGQNRGSSIKGRSVHNQRIERFWRDVYTKVLDKYHRTFHHMETSGILDVNNSIHIAVLHHVFGNRIQKDLSDWQNAHNNHIVRTEKRTPLQLWYSGALKNASSNLLSMNNIFNRSLSETIQSVDDYLSENNLDEPGDISIVLPRYPLPLTGGEELSLHNDIDIMRESNSYGIDIYAEVLVFVDTCNA